MSAKSPLRYPGGKTRAISILERYVQEYYPDRRSLLSPFFGGGSFELYLHEKGYKVFGNDLFGPLLIFWKTVQEKPEMVKTAVEDVLPITKDVFSILRESIESMIDPIEIATAYYIINRCSFSGATFCGGFSQEASTGRLNESCIQSLTNVKLTNIVFSNQDCLHFLQSHPESADTVIYADPPYYIDTYIYGKDGDMHAGFDHCAFAAFIRTRRDWILSYNDCAYIRELYAGCRFFTESWSYGMNATKASSELIILPPLI